MEAVFRRDLAVRVPSQEDQLLALEMSFLSLSATVCLYSQPLLQVGTFPLGVKLGSGLRYLLMVILIFVCNFHCTRYVIFSASVPAPNKPVNW